MLKRSFLRFWHLDIVRTLYLNFVSLPLYQAVKIPIIVYHGTKIVSTNGSVTFNVNPRFGMVIIGGRSVGTIVPRSSATIWEIRGNLFINGKVMLGLGTRISVAEEASLYLGNNFEITGSSSVLCKKRIEFEDNCLLSWDILIMDSDWHRILNGKGEIINPSQSVHIGKHVWIGCRSIILKGVSIPPDSVIASGSIITKSFNEGNCIIGGTGSLQNVLKESVNWKR